jgi:hypothetical protein
MGTDSIIIICVVIVAVLIAIFHKPSKDLTVTIKMEDDDYPINDDGVEELEVKPKRVYKKRTSKVNVVKKPVGRPKKIK